MTDADLWQIVLYLHLLAMAFFLGGQLFLGLVIVPYWRRDPDAFDLGPIARRFGLGSLIAIALAIVTGAALASHLDLWGSPTLQAKLGVLVALIALALAHLRRPHAHALQALVLLATLVIVYLGLELTT